MQEVVDATLLEKVETSIKSNKSLQMLYIRIEHSGVVEAVLKGARGNTTLKELTIESYGKQHQDTTNQTKTGNCIYLLRQTESYSCVVCHICTYVCVYTNTCNVFFCNSLTAYCAVSVCVVHTPRGIMHASIYIDQSMLLHD